MGKSAGAVINPRVLLSLLCAMLFVGAGYPLLMPAEGRRGRSLTLREVERKKKDALARLKRTTVQVKKAKSDYQEIQMQRVREESRLEQATAAWDEARESLAKATVMLRQAEARRRDHQEAFADRLVEIHEHGELSYLDVFLGSESFADFANQMYLARLVVEDDIKLLRALEADEASVGNYRRQVAEQERRAATYRELVAARRAAVAAAQAAQQVEIERLVRDKARYEREFAKWEATSKELAAVIRRQSRTYRIVPWTGSLKPPVAGRISSGFGMRRHPILGGVRMHTGVDIAAPYGTAIRASGDGVVIDTGWHNGYGRTIIISHGGNLSTLYAHCSSISAREGQKVKQGDVIGRVGATGLATGPHVHFEVRVNGSCVDPLKY